MEPGARFYPLLYLLSRVHGARDLGSGIELKNHLLGQHSALEVHHIFPKALLYRNGYSRPEVNALGNFTFLTLDTNRALGGRSPAEYLATAEKHNPGVLGSNWIPADPGLWQVEQYVEFLAARRELLAEAANDVLDDLWGGRIGEPAGHSPLEHGAVQVSDGDEETEQLAKVQEWVRERGLVAGIEAFALLELDGTRQEAVLDLAWPDGLRYGEERIALLLNEPAATQEAAGRHGYRFFTSVDELMSYVEREVVAAVA